MTRVLSIASLLLCVCQPALGGANTYQCTIKEQLTLHDNGLLTRPPNAWLIGKRFAVDRDTGMLTGPETALWSTASSKYTVLARGNRSNAFTAIATDTAAENGVHTTLLKVEEYAPTTMKPFVLLSGSEVASGVCE